MFRAATLTLALVALLTNSALAQGPGTKFGAVAGGATLSDMNNAPGVGDSRWGGTAGLLVGMNTGPTALTFEANWVQKGGGDVRLDYIELPLTLGAVGELGGGAARGRIYSGVSFGFKISCSSPTISCDSAEGTEWGLPLGIQVAKINSASGSFFGLDVRYTVSLSDAFDFGDIHNRPWSFRLLFGKQLGRGSSAL
jgi:hypothetical protein